jgi:hypothetical protein
MDNMSDSEGDSKQAMKRMIIKADAADVSEQSKHITY